MQSRRPTVSTLLLPHPPLPHRRSSILSVDSAGSQPRTPRNGRSPNPSQIFFTPSRKSTDSWNSSNADEVEWEWKPDQVLLLSRTLDALPAHLVTPFNGPIPPPNLLDKIARGVATAKGPEDWPHSLRATRVKLIELARSKGKGEADHQRRQNTITEEPEIEDGTGSNYSYMHDGAERPLSIGARRKPCRQSSMDFIDTAGKDIKNNPDIARLSRRLQRSERAFHAPAFHPYSRAAHHANRRSASPPPLANVPSLISPSSNSSDTLNTFSSFSSDPRVLRRSISSMSSISSGSGMALPDPRVQRIRRSESTSLAAPPRLGAAATVAPQPSVGVKRAPSYGALAQEVRRERKESLVVTSPPGVRHERRDSGSYPSSDEEEKARSRNAKKARVKSGSKTVAPTCSPSTSAVKKPASPGPPPVPEKDRKVVRPVQVQSPKPLPSSPPSAFKMKKTAKVEGSLGLKEAGAPAKRPAPMNLQRNPSMFGPELPHIQQQTSPSVMKRMRTTVTTPPASPMPAARPRVAPSRIFRSPSPSPLSPASALACALSPTALMVAPDSPTSPSLMASPPLSPQSQRVKTLRRVRRLVPARRISFGSMRTNSDDMDLGTEVEAGRSCLGSAFQLL